MKAYSCNIITIVPNGVLKEVIRSPLDQDGRFRVRAGVTQHQVFEK